jgi:hypothetical protein
MVQKHDALINGARPHFVKNHFVKKRTFSYRKWGLAPFILAPFILYRKWGLAPFILAPFIPKASLSSPSESNHARSAFLTVFSPYSLRQAGKTGKKVACSFFI